MKNLHKGSILDLNLDMEYDYIKVNGDNVTNTNHLIPIQYNKNRLYDNYNEYLPIENTQLIINYIKHVKCDNKIGLLRFREFEGPFYKDTIIKHIVYNLTYPFLMSEYYDGTSFYIQLKEVHIDYKIASDGLIIEYKDNIYQLINAKSILFSGSYVQDKSTNIIQVYFRHNLALPCNYNFCITNRQVIFFHTSLFDKYKKLNDTNKKEMTSLYNEMIQQEYEDNIIVYEITNNELEEIYVREGKLFRNQNLVIYKDKKLLINFINSLTLRNP